MIIDLQTYKNTQTQPEKRTSREVSQSRALHREAPKAVEAGVLSFQPYKSMTQTRIVLRPRTANGATRGRLAQA